MEVNLDELKEAYKQAVEEDKLSFTYNNFQFYTQYAKFLIEYLETLKTP